MIGLDKQERIKNMNTKLTDTTLKDGKGNTIAIDKNDITLEDLKKIQSAVNRLKKAQETKETEG